ncbi:MAG: carboxymuconolactone decarboxylase family protein [Gammaproteobacteria bacterium]|nr:carboxymuconolactone decarboxylase family protein [Gammaproteobacteria bacterium]
MSDGRREKGRKLVAKLFKGISGNARSVMSPSFSAFTIEHLYGEVWQQDDLALEERSLATCAILIALNRPEEQAGHFQVARNLGIPREKLCAVITHAAYYAGWPNAVGAFRVLNEVWPEE